MPLQANTRIYDVIDSLTVKGTGKPLPAAEGLHGATTVWKGSGPAQLPGNIVQASHTSG